tara:strand:- start:518 stop:1411 length:894 start_codon:yes stop_codon:yes gene_type:complete
MEKYKKIFWISSYPKSGNTWIRLILCGLFFSKDGRIENLNILENIPKLDTYDNFKFIKNISIKDYNKIFKSNQYDEGSTSTLAKYWIESQKKISGLYQNIGFFKTHNARLKFKEYDYTNEITTLGFIYVYRDPRDIAISYSKHLNKEIESTINFMKSNNILGNQSTKNRMPEFIYNWQDHYKSWKNFIKVPSLFIKYENLISDIEKEINNIIYYFDKNHNISIENKNEKIKNIIKTTKFKNLQKIEKQKGFLEKSKFSVFFRKGKFKQWQNELNLNQISLIEKSFKQKMIDLKYLKN